MRVINDEKEGLRLMHDELLESFIKLLCIDTRMAFVFAENVLANIRAYARISQNSESEFLEDILITSDEKAEVIVKNFLRKDRR